MLWSIFAYWLPCRSSLLLFSSFYLYPLAHWLSLPFIFLYLSFYHFLLNLLFTVFFFFALELKIYLNRWGHREMSTLIIWLLKAEDALSIVALCFVISGENWEINLPWLDELMLATLEQDCATTNKTSGSLKQTNLRVKVLFSDLR